MKRIVQLFFIALVLSAFVNTGFSQNLEQKNVKTVNLRNTGAIIQNGVVVGYYNFYNLEKEDRKNNNYLLSVSDENLRLVNSINIVRPNTYILVNGAFNGSAFCFLFYDMKERSLELISYDSKLKQLGSVAKKIDNKFASAPYIYIAQGHEPMQAFIQAVPNKGFIYYGIKEDSKSDFEIEFLDNAMKRKWVNYAPNDQYEFETAMEAFQNEDYVGSLAIKRTALLDLNPDFDLLVQNVATGKVLFRIPLATAKYKLALADFTYDKAKNQFTMFGEYYNLKDNPMKDESQGLINVVLDMTGKVVSEKTSSWIADITPKVDAQFKSKFEKTGIMFHDFIRTNDGDLFAIGEQYKKGGTPMTVRLNVFNLVVFQYDANFSLKKVHFFEKEKSSIGMPPGMLIGSSKLISYIAKSYGGFDYRFSQLSADSETFILTYDNRSNLYSVVYTPEKTFTTDKISISKTSDTYLIYPAKQGYIMIGEYFAKQKNLNYRLEKVNY